MSACSHLLACVRLGAARVAGMLMPMLLLSAAGAAHAQIHPWTTAASAGVVDDNDTGIVEFINGEGRVRAAAPAGSVLNLRYNVVSLQGFAGPGTYIYRTRFLDNGPGARVQVALTRYRVGFAPSALHTIDSNTFPAQVGYQTQQRCIVVDWNFIDSVYYIEATLTKSAADGQPALATIQLIPGQCTG